MTKEIRPTTLAGIKSLANQLKRSQDIKHHIALDLAAQQAGYQNIRHAQRALKGAAGVKQPVASYKVYVTAYWRDSSTRALGRETLSVALSKPWIELVEPAKLPRSKRLEGFHGVALNHLELRFNTSSQSQARSKVCEAVRALQFMDATGLRPTSAWTRAFPGVSSDDSLPGQDHASVWYDRSNKRYVVADEPYEAAANECSVERAAWAERNGFSIIRPNWRGMYNPDGESQIYLVSHREKGVPLESIARALDGLPSPVTETNWNGESAPTFPSFSPPDWQPLPVKKRAAVKVPRKHKAANTGMHPARKLLVEGMNHLVRNNLVSLTGGEEDESGHCMALVAGKPSLIRWNDIGHQELSFSVWWDYDHSKHPQANLQGNAREEFHTAAPLAKRRHYPKFVGAVAAGWFERKTGQHIQGTGSGGIHRLFMRPDAKQALQEMVNPVGEGFSTEGSVF